MLVKLVKEKFVHHISRIIRIVVSVHRRNKRLIVYGGAMDLFVDNAKHMFLYNNINMPEYRHVWLSNNESVLNKVQSLGLEAVKSHSRQGVFLMWNAGMVIYDYHIDEFSYHNLSAGAVRFNLWHGVPNKHIGGPVVENPNPYKIESLFRHKYVLDHKKGDYALSPSNSGKMNNIFSSAFYIPLENIIISAYPRCRFLNMSKLEIKMYIEKYEDEQYLDLYNELSNRKDRAFIYMPTFRDANKEYIYSAIPDWVDFDNFLSKFDIKLYIKVHRMTPLPSNLNFSHIKIIDNTIDIYPILSLFDRLITDYSSVMYEFAILEKPIILYTFDMDEYVSKSRYIYKDFIELTKKVPRAKTYNELKLLLTKPDSSLPVFPNEMQIGGINSFCNIVHFIESKLED